MGASGDFLAVTPGGENEQIASPKGAPDPVWGNSEPRIRISHLARDCYRNLLKCNNTPRLKDQKWAEHSDRGDSGEHGRWFLGTHRSDHSGYRLLRAAVAEGSKQAEGCELQIHSR